jgi:hypothetical protein
MRRNRPLELARLLRLPENAYVVFGMAVGRPAAESAASIKPLLPIAEILHRGTYDAAARAGNVESYNAEMRRFYAAQNLDIPGDWSLHSAKRVGTVAALRGRDALKAALRSRGFALR